MKYYQVVKQVEGCAAPSQLNYILVLHELFTPAEVKRYDLQKYARYLQEVEASRKQSFYSFGCHFNLQLANCLQKSGGVNSDPSTR